MSPEEFSISDDEPISLEPEGSDDEPIISSPQPLKQQPAEGNASAVEPVAEEEEPLSLVEPSETAGGGGDLKAFGAAAAGGVSHKKDFKRPMNLDGRGATRCRVFHAKIADSSLLHMETTINEWADAEGVEVKHVGHLVGTMTGKKAEDNVIVVVWY
ncbi:MAG: hypothetical protein ACLFV7_07010 [Phycisphaerae bacterium]